MRRPLRALLCLGSLAALATPVTAAQAAVTATQASVGAGQASVTAAGAATSSPADLCWIAVARPSIDSKGVIRALGARVGCDDEARLRIRLVEARRGPDRVLKSGSKALENGALALKVRCSDEPRLLYVLATDDQGNKEISRTVRLSCESASTSTPPPTSTPTTTTTPSAPPASQPSGGTVGTDVENEVVRLTNQARQQNGCGALKHDAKLRTAAFGHSADMAAKGYFSHNSPDGRNPGDRIQAAGFTPIRAWGENIAMGQRTAADVVKAWLDSPGHRANIMNCNFTHIGVGHHTGGSKGGPYWTQAFARN
jgi:uncharacterized protein YkwD